jgi:hypothetical protein
MTHAGFHIWAPELRMSPGGIQTFSNFWLEGLRAVCPETRVTVLSKNDLPGLALDGVATTCSGAVPAWQRTAAYAAEVLRTGLEARPALVMAMHLNFAPAAALLKRLSGTPYWVVAHGVEAWGPHGRFMRAALRSADRVLAVSQHTRSRLLEQGFLNPDRVCVLPNTFDSRRFEIRPKSEALLKKHHLRAVSVHRQMTT